MLNYIKNRGNNTDMLSAHSNSERDGFSDIKGRGRNGGRNGSSPPFAPSFMPNISLIALTEEGINNIKCCIVMSTIIKRLLFSLSLLFLTTHCLYAQQAMSTDSCKMDTIQTRLDTIAKRSGKKVITCAKCKGKGYLVREELIPFTFPKGKKSCSFCNVEYLDNIRHFHVECSECWRIL